MTVLLHVDPHQPDPEAIATAAKAIAAGRLVAFPTETVYGLGANALDAAAVDRIFAAKQRPYTDPLIVHLASAKQIHRVATDIPHIAERLAERFWPGPLTLILKRHPAVPAKVSAGRDTVAVRVPAHPVAHALLTACGVPIAAPSANLFGRPSPTTAQHVIEDLDGRVDLVLDGGPTTIGLESTVIDLTMNPPALLRPGGAGIEALRELLPDLNVPTTEIVADGTEAASSPGTLLKHYSPRATLILIRGEAGIAQRLAANLIAQVRARGGKTGVLVPDEELNLYAGLPAEIVGLGPAADLSAVARSLFAHLRELDRREVDVILAREPDGAGLGPAIRDRLFRAAEGRIIEAERPADPARLIAELLPTALRETV